ncbi:DUF5522 domain-containing protein [Hymenobacter persicinus]|uniref:Uncharacterized protein n=1 Tax=Hymenobacter persicinus TaxID=2025506 RepID=A0A4Q5L8L0_9BACT|nr:DUF5522 domain-containing protein [Hymenobacter persicinus]RYU75474.1 hypothetical protein EWM57_19855 [Hymenobacter persicinus]
MAAKPQPLQPGDFYLTPEGYMVFTEQYHLRRGSCCKSGCRHCPWGFDPVTQKATRRPAGG